MTHSRTIALLSSFFLAGFGTVAFAQREPHRLQSPAPNRAVLLKTPEPHTPMEHNNRGVELGSKAIWPDAIREHELALSMDPHNTIWRTNLSAAHLEYGKYLAKLNKKDAAAGQFRLAMVIDPANKTADNELDKTLASQKKDPLDYACRKGLAEDFDSKSQHADAIAEWRKCIALRDSALDHANLGRSLLRSGKEIEGFNELKDAVGRSGWPADEKIEQGACHRDLGDLLQKLARQALKAGRSETGIKRLNNAVIEYRRAAALNTADGQAVQGLIDTTLLAVSLHSSFDNHLTLALAYVLGGDFPHAKQELKFCKKIDPNRPELTEARIALYEALAKSPLKHSDEFLKETIDELNADLQKEPENTKFLQIMSGLYTKLGDTDKANAYSEKAKKLEQMKKNLERDALP